MLCKPHPLLCAWIAQLQSNSGQTWRIEYQCFNLNRDKKPWPSFVRRQKNYNWKKIELKLFGPHLKVGSTSKGFTVKKPKTGKLAKKLVLVFYICWDYAMSYLTKCSVRGLSPWPWPLHWLLSDGLLQTLQKKMETIFEEK